MDQMVLASSQREEEAAASFACRSACASLLPASTRFCFAFRSRNGTRPTWPLARAVCLQLPLVSSLALLFCLCLRSPAAAARLLLPAAARPCLALRTRNGTRPTRLLACAVRLLLPLVLVLALVPLLCLRSVAAASRTEVGPAWLPARAVRMQVSRVPCLCCLLPLACRCAVLPCSVVLALPSPLLPTSKGAKS